jgi:hypothetical protein
MEEDIIIETAYWYLNDNDSLCIDNLDFLKHLNKKHGFYNAMINGQRHIVRVVSNIVDIVEDKTFIVDCELRWLESNFGTKIEEGVYKEHLKGKLLNKMQFLLNDTSIMFLPLITIQPHFDSKERVYFYFSNIAIVVTKDKINQVKYDDLDGYVMRDQVMGREFKIPDDEEIFESPYAKFYFNICNRDDARLESLMSITGYLLSRYQNPVKAKAVVLLDAHINELDGHIEGGRGKSLLALGLSKMRMLVDIDGKSFKSSYQFNFGSVTPYTNIVCINDLKQNENFENHFGLTEGITINQKYKPTIKLPFEYSPKRLFTSNFILKTPSGNSTDRRICQFELGDHYGKNLTVFDDFKHLFFHDWTKKQWNEFTIFMFFCVQLFLREGLIEASSIHLEERKLITEVGIEYIDFFDQILITKKAKFHKKEMYNEFINGGYVQQRYRPNQRMFTIKFKKYCEYKGIVYKETPLNTKAYFEIINEDKQSSLTTIEDVDTEYKTVNSANKMTRLVKRLTKHFYESTDKILAIDLETTGLDCHNDKIVSMAITFSKRTGYNVIFPENRTKALKFIEPLLVFLTSNRITKVFHNAKFDLKFLKYYGIPVNGIIEDTMILDYFLDPNRKTHGLKEISELHLGYKQISFKRLTNGKSITDVPLNELTKYACEDTDLTYQLYNYITNKL